jgi:hypothetical protein
METGLAPPAESQPDADSRTGTAGLNRGAWLATGAACISAVISVIAAYGAFDQIDLAKRQNEIADRQSLGVLVADITEDKRALEKTTAISRRAAVEEAMLADAEEALALVETQARPAPGIDNYEIGEAFLEGGATEYHNALTSFRRAAQSGTDPRYRASALRGEAHILIELGGPTNLMRARRALELAYRSYERQPDMTSHGVEFNYAYTDLYAVPYEAPVDCAQARAYLDQGEQVIHMHPSIVESDLTLRLQVAERSIARCS